MIEKVDNILNKIHSIPAVLSFKFGHTPTQIEFFQTSNQQGDEKWEYWQHILQLKSLEGSLQELRVSYDEVQDEIDDALALWPFWSIKKRLRKIPRLRLKQSNLDRSIAEKTREVEFHLEIIERKYKHLKTLEEDDILKEESGYWSRRLSRQLGVSHLSRILGVSESELLAVLALPKEQQRQIFEGMRELLGTTTPLLPIQKRE